jgi:hypothetical protein
MFLRLRDQPLAHAFVALPQATGRRPLATGLRLLLRAAHITSHSHVTSVPHVGPGHGTSPRSLLAQAAKLSLDGAGHRGLLGDGGGLLQELQEEARRTGLDAPSDAEAGIQHTTQQCLCLTGDDVINLTPSQPEPPVSHSRRQTKKEM